MNSCRFLWTILLGLYLVLGWKNPLQAKTQYVTDSIKIAMRSGKSTKHKILRMLPSGTSVEVLTEHPGSGYSRVRALGETGWVLTSYLMDRPGAQEQLSQLKERLQVLQSSPENTRNALISLQEEHQTLQRTCAQTETTRQQLEQELVAIQRISADAVRINNDRIELQKTVVNLTREREDLKQELRDVRNQMAHRWFLSGAGVLLFGLLAGAILPHIRWKRRRDTWGSI
jgi:SH3 domain protein